MAEVAVERSPSSESAQLQVNAGSTSWFSLTAWRDWLKWKPTSMALLVEAEQKLLSHLAKVYEGSFVAICRGQKRLWNVQMNTQSKKVPIVLLHGMGGGVGLWALNLDNLSENRPLYAMDVLGFGRSSRPNFSKNPEIAELEFVDSVEEWRQKKGLEQMILCGHSLGGYIAAAYTLRHPEKVKHLILADPWGFKEKPVETANTARRLPLWARAIITIMQPFNPLSGLRAAGPWGPSLVMKFRPDLQQKFSELEHDTSIFDYIYHCNAQTPSGEVAYKTLALPRGWAKNPMLLRIKDIDKDVPMTFVYGSRSWMDNDAGHQAKFHREGCYVDVQVVKGAGHHVYADRPEEFNSIVNRICSQVDLNLGEINESGINIREDSLHRV